MSGRRGVQGAFSHVARAHDGGSRRTASLSRRLLFRLDARGRDDLTPLPPLLLDHGFGLPQRAAGGEQLELAKAALHLASCKASLIAALSFITTSAGVLGGALIAFQVDEINSG
jgi:hypothetical protein